MSVQALRDRVAELAAMERRLQACLDDVRAAGEQAMADLAGAAAGDMALRPLGAAGGKPQGFHHRPLRLETVRDAVVTLKRFTIGELAAELGCSNARARRELDRVMQLVKPDGGIGKRQIWAYVPPDGPGAAFTQQQKLRVPEPTVSRTPGGEVRQSIISMVSDKEIKAVVREALRDGWELVHTGGRHHLALVKGGRTVGLPSTPTNSGNTARALRRELNAA